MHAMSALQRPLADTKDLIAYANRSSSRGVGVTYCRQCHDLVCIHRRQGFRGGKSRSCKPRRNAVIIGPAETAFEDGTFRLVMHFEEQYPNKPPGVKFISQMFHPNVYGTGELCLDILQNRWSPTYDVAAVLTSIQRYLPHPFSTPDIEPDLTSFEQSPQRS